ncbi:MAG TPA: hypothetical protein VLT36_00545, partial [Candidatus Dormibacteraeota bacterium]|nr:hypothetical protein [Candidatus Dormibacteraeota bacterium]
SVSPDSLSEVGQVRIPGGSTELCVCLHTSFHYRMPRTNQRTSSNGPITLLFRVERPGRAVLEPQCS